MELAKGIGQDKAKECLLPYYIIFLDDPESEVRTAAVGRLSEICKILDSQTIITKILPLLKKL